MSALAAVVCVPAQGVATAAAAVAVTAAPEPIAHEVYVAKITNKGEHTGTDAEIMSAVNTALDNLENLLDDRIAFTVRRIAESNAAGMVEYESDLDCSSGSALRREARELDAWGSRTFGSAGARHLLVVAPLLENGQGCIGTASASVGDDLNSGGSLVFPYKSTVVHTLMHELGHNLGLEHANGRRCAPADVALTRGADARHPDDLCPNDEYHDGYNVMGPSTTSTPGALNSYQRVKVGITSDQEIKRVSAVPGERTTVATVDLLGRGTSAGIRGVELADPVDGTLYWVDFRNGLGLDAKASYLSQGAWYHHWFNRGVTVATEEVDSPEENDLGSSLRTFPQVDGTGWRYGLTAGEFYRSANGRVRVQVLSMPMTGSESDAARLRVTLTDTRVAVGDAGTLADQGVYELEDLAGGRVVGRPELEGGSGQQMVAQVPTGAAAQQWRAVLRADGRTYRLRNLVSGKCLDVARGSDQEGAAIIEWSCHSGSNQAWQLVGGENGYGIESLGSGLTLGLEGDGVVQDGGDWVWSLARVA